MKRESPNNDRHIDDMATARSPKNLTGVVCGSAVFLGAGCVPFANTSLPEIGFNTWVLIGVLAAIFVGLVSFLMMQPGGFPGNRTGRNNHGWTCDDDGWDDGFDGGDDD